MGVIASCFSPSVITYTAPEIIPEIRLTAELSIQEKIVVRAREYGVDPTLAFAIAKAENDTFDPDRKNPSPVSSASGIYQFLDGTFKHFCMEQYKLTRDFSKKNNPDIQIACAMRMLKEGRESHWNASKEEWGKVIASR